MQVLLTGATGFVGARLLDELLKHPVVDLVICLSRSPRAGAAGPEDARIRWIHGDLRDKSWHSQVPAVDVVVHVAANASFGNDDDHAAVNHDGTISLLECAARVGARHFIFISTIGAVDRQAQDAVSRPLDGMSTPAPRSLYGRSKLRAEQAVRASGIPFSIIRPAWVYGRGMRRGSHLATLALMVKHRSALSAFDWPGQVSLVHVDDLCRAVSKIAMQGMCVDQTLYAATERVALGRILATFGAAYGSSVVGSVPVPARCGRAVVSRLHGFMPLSVANLFVDYLTCESEPFVDLIAPEKPVLFFNRYEDILQTIDPLRKTWLITGAGSGIGQSLATLLSQNGVHVIGVDRGFPDPVSKLGRRVVLDLTGPDAVGDLRGIIDREEIGVVVNNAGVGFKGAFAGLSGEQVATTVAVNVVVPIQLAHSVIPLLSRRRGTLVNIASSMAGVPLPGMGLYSASKGCLQAWSLGLAEELRGTVTVLTVSPTGTRTNFQRCAGVRGGQRTLLSPELVAQAILDAVVQEKSYAFVGRWPMRLALFLGRLLPLPVQARVWGKLFGNLR